MDIYEAHWIGVNRKRSEQSPNMDQKLLETIFDCHLSQDGLQKAIENSVSIKRFFIFFRR